MVKGVKRNIIEVNTTGSDCFEKIVFYISPHFSLAGKNIAELAANELSGMLGGSPNPKRTLRYQVKAKKRARLIVLSACAVILLGVIAFLIFK